MRAGWLFSGVRAAGDHDTAVVAVLSPLAGGRQRSLSALFGAAVAWVTTLYASSRASVPEHTVGAALQRVMVGEFIKVLATIALFGVAARVPHMVWPALLCGYVAALVASWLPSMVSSGRNENWRCARQGRGARITSGLGL